MNRGFMKVYMSIRIPSRRKYYVSVPLSFLTDYKVFIQVITMYLGLVVLTMGYIIGG